MKEGNLERNRERKSEKRERGNNTKLPPFTGGWMSAGEPSKNVKAPIEREREEEGRLNSTPAWLQQ